MEFYTPAEFKRKLQKYFNVETRITRGGEKNEYI